jgi:hypothetical protein
MPHLGWAFFFVTISVSEDKIPVPVIDIADAKGLRSGHKITRLPGSSSHTGRAAAGKRTFSGWFLATERAA